MHAGLLDVFHHAADEDALAIADAIDIDFDRIVQEAVQQHRRLVLYLDRLAHVALQVTLLVHDFHRPPAQHVARAHHQRIADFLRPGAAPRPRCARCALGGWRRPSSCSSCWKRSRSSAASIMSGEVPMMGTPLASRSQRQLERRLAAVLDDHAAAAFPCRRSPARLPASAARSTGGRRCRSRWKRFPGCS